MGEEENDYATKQSSLLMRSSDHLSTFKLLNEINVTSTSTSEFECSSYFCRVKYTLPNKQLKANPNDDKEIKERSDKLKANDSSIDYGSQVNSQSNINLIDFQVDNSSKAALQTESKPNMVVQGEVKNQSRRLYKFVANNYRFRMKFDIKKLSDNIDISNYTCF